MTQFVVQRSVSGWNVVDITKVSRYGIPHVVVERHRNDRQAAENSCKRLNGICLHCDRPLAECKKDMPRDENFGAEFDDSDDES